VKALAQELDWNRGVEHRSTQRWNDD